MSSYTGSVPETKRKPDWRDNAACRDEDPETFFPSGTDVGWKKVEAQARSICFRCPVRPACLEFSLTEGIRDGIFGGLTEQERTTLRRRATRKKTDTATITVTAIDVEPPAPKPTSLRALWNTHARPFGDGHVTWHGNPTPWFRGRSYTPRKIAFILDRGREPKGRVITICELSTCIDPTHVADDSERTRCGTRPGYQRHLKEGSEICGPCRQANTDADNQLRRTGSTKAAA